MKAIPFTRRCIRFVPEAGQEEKTGYGQSQEAPRNRFRWPSDDQHKLIRDCPKYEERYGQQ
jgi:hypothetical protein